MSFSHIFVLDFIPGFVNLFKFSLITFSFIFSLISMFHVLLYRKIKFMSKITQNYLLSLYFQLNIMVISFSLLELHFIYDLK